MKRLFFLIVFTIFSISCGYKVKTYPQLAFSLKSFDFKDPFLLEFKKDIEWRLKDKLYSSGFFESHSSNPELLIFIEVAHNKTFTVQSGSDNRQTARELNYVLKCSIVYKGRTNSFKDRIKIYEKFPVQSEYFLDKRKELAKQLGDEIALRLNSWITKIIL